MSRSAGYPLAAVTAWGPLFAIVSSGPRHVDAFNVTSVRYLASLIMAGGWRPGRAGARRGRAVAGPSWFCSARPASTCWPASR